MTAFITPSGVRAFMGTAGFRVILPLILTLAARFPIIAADNVSEYKGRSTIELIEEAYLSGKISRGDRLFYYLQTVYAPQDLPSEFTTVSQVAIRSATPIINEVLDNWHFLAPQQQTIAAEFLARPIMDTLYISPDSHFIIHYDTASYDAVPLDDSDLDGTPDYVERIGLYADSCYRHYHLNLGYLPPSSDGDVFYDIYLLSMGNYYGATVRETGGDSSWNDYSSYIQIHNTLAFAPPNQDPEGSVIGAQKVTCAHEYFHATQLAYAYVRAPHLWWTEGTAVYFEDVVFEEVNDNYGYLPYFFNYPDTFLIDTATFPAGYHNYSAFVWPTFLAERFNIDVIRAAWEFGRYGYPPATIDSALSLFGMDMKSAFPEFTVWNYFTADRADPDYYQDGVDYPPVVIDQTISSYPFSNIGPVNPPDGLASNYLVAYPSNSQNGLLALNFDGDDMVEWGFSYITFEGEAVDVTMACPFNSAGRARCGIYDFLRYDSIVFIPCVVSRWNDDNEYVFSTDIVSFGDVDGSGEMNMLDIFRLIAYLYKSGQPPEYTVLMGDVDCSGLINMLDVLYLIKYLYHGGPEPCPDGPYYYSP
jgi:hypothetical protein